MKKAKLDTTVVRNISNGLKDAITKDIITKKSHKKSTWAIFAWFANIQAVAAIRAGIKTYREKNGAPLEEFVNAIDY